MNGHLTVHEWFSYSHWGMFRLGLFTAPDWYAFGCQGDDDLLDWVSP